MSNPNTIDYSNLNKSLQPKRKIDGIKTNVAKAIWDVFLKSNGFDSRKKGTTKTNKLNQFSSKIEGASEWMKSNFILAINYLSKNNLIKTDKVKSLKLNVLEDETKTSDEKLSNILDELVQALPEADRLKLDQDVSKWLLNLSDESRKAWELWDRITNLEQENSDLKNELDAVTEVSERAVLTRRSRYKMIRVWNSIKNINNNSSLDPETKARKILWQANSFAIFGSWKRFDWIYNKLPLKFDVKKEYEKSVSKLMRKMDESSDDGEKVAIRYIMRQVNKAYKDYIDATNISEETRKQNMRDINMKMAA